MADIFIWRVTHECGTCAFVCGTYMGNTNWQNPMKLYHAVIGDPELSVAPDGHT